MKTSISLFLLFALSLAGCASAPPVNERKVASKKDASPVEPAEIQGVIQAQGGESDNYFIKDKKLGKIELYHYGKEAYWAIRNNEGKTAVLWGSWDESQDRQLVFVVYKVTVLDSAK